MTGRRDGGPALVPVMDVGGTHVTAALVDVGAGAVIASTVRRRTLRPSAPAEELLESILSCGRALPAPSGASWGVAVPGPFDYDRGVALYADVGKFESLYGIDVGQALRAGLPGPAGSLRFLNDADAFLLGEWLFGAAAGHDPCAAITLGTGVGSAFLSGGVVRQDGPGVPPEGRVDLLRIDGRPLEDIVSTRAIEREFERRQRRQPTRCGPCRRPRPGRGPGCRRRAVVGVRGPGPGAVAVAGRVRGRGAGGRRLHDRVMGSHRAGAPGRDRGGNGR